MIKFSQTLKKNLKLLGFGLVLATVVFLFTNWPYFWENIKYDFAKPAPVTVSPAPTSQLQIASDTSTIKPASPKTSNNVPAKPLTHDPAGTLIIQSLGTKAPVMRIYEVSERAFQAALIDGVVHYPGSAEPGQVGNDYIFGHSSDYIWSSGHYKTIFATLPKIKIGDTVLISDLAGHFYNYKVTSTKIVVPTDLSVLSQNTAGKKILTVQTSFPVGTALKRFVAICELVE